MGLSFDRTILSEATDLNLLYDLETHLEDFGFYEQEDVDAFAHIYFDPKGTQGKLQAILRPVVARYNEASEDERVSFRGALADYVRLYAFLSQILPFTDAQLEKLYVLGRLLIRQ